MMSEYELPFSFGTDRWTSFEDMTQQDFEPPFGKVLAASFAGVLVSVGVVVEFGSAVEMLADKRVHFSTHCSSKSRYIICLTIELGESSERFLLEVLPSTMREVVELDCRVREQRRRSELC